MKDNVLLIGMPGCGKSSLGKTLSRELTMKYVDMDIYIEETSHKKISEMFEESEDCFRREETRCAKELSKVKNHVIAAGGGVVTRKENIDYLKESCTIIYVNRSIKKILNGRNISNRPLLKKDNKKIYELYEQRRHLYEEYSDFTVYNNGYFKYCINDIIDKLEK